MLLAYWFLLPILLGATFAGLGLGVRKLSVPFHSALLVPLGYAVAILLAALITFSGHTKGLTGPVIFLLGVAGWAVSFKEVKAAILGGYFRRQWPWMAAGILAFLAFGASVILSGKPTYTGYNQIVDIASQMDWASYLGDFGRHMVGDQSFWINSRNGTPLNGYPAGPQALLATFPSTFGFDMAWSWNVYLAIMAASLVGGLYALLRQVTDSRAFAAVGAFTAGQASPLINYGLIGGIKEISAIVTVVAAGALIPTTFRDEETPHWRAALPFAVALAGAFSVFSLTILPWLGILAAGAAIAIWQLVSLRAALVRGGIALLTFAIITLPTSIPAKDSLQFAKLMENELGNLAEPVSLWATTGIWITDDHRYALEGTGLTISIILGVLVIALMLVGVWTAVRGKAWDLLTLWAASVIGATILVVKYAQWIEFKGMVLAAPVVLLFAVVGLVGLRALPRKEFGYAAWAGLAVLLLVSLYTDGIRFGSTTVAPHDRLTELRGYGKEFDPTRATLIPDWDENGAHEMRKTNAIQAFNAVFEPSEEWAKDPNRPQPYQYEWDLDQLYPPFANKHDLIVLRRSPGQSRPGRAFKLRTQGRFFQVWQRTSEPATVAHIPLTGLATDPDRVKCRTLIRSMPDNATLTYAPTAPAFSAVLDAPRTTQGLVLAEGNGSVSFNGLSGRSEGSVDVGQSAGTYEVYATSTSNRSVEVTVADKTFDVEVDPSAAVRSQYLGTVTVGTGVQNVRIEAGGTSLRPGTSKKFNIGSYVGNIQLIPPGQLHPELVKTTPREVNCALPMDWMETP